LTYGLAKAGIPVLAGIDLDPACRFPFEANNHSRFLGEDVASLKGDDLIPLYPDGAVKIMVGCAPCQPFSQYSRGQRRPRHQKWDLLRHFSRLVEEVRPTVVSMENVPGLLRQPVFRDFTKRLEANGYHVTHSTVFCPDYGIPQQRTRLVLFASLRGRLSLLRATHRPREYRTVGNALSGLPSLSAGGVDPHDPLHRACHLTPRNLQRIRVSEPGGHWRDWPRQLVSDCHRAESGKTYVSVYGRMEWDKPSPTITTQFFGFGNGRHGHPQQDRALSLREGAILQSFPRRYQFCARSDGPSIATLGRLIGNAVPVRLGQIIGKSILKHLEGPRG
jgi:DNA (cytosine-5)-methyltransferase 1